MTNCLEKHVAGELARGRIVKADADALRAAFRVEVGRGVAEDAAQLKVIDDHIAGLRAERGRVERDVVAAWGRVAPSPQASETVKSVSEETLKVGDKVRAKSSADGSNVALVGTVIALRNTGNLLEARVDYGKNLGGQKIISWKQAWNLEVVPGEAGAGSVAERGNNQALPKGVAALVDDLLGGARFANIVAARKRVAELTGEPVAAAGSVEAKRVDELVELAGVAAARRIVAEVAASGVPVREVELKTYDRLLDLAERLPALNARTSTSVRDQAYSTPLPLAYVASRLAGIAEGAGAVLEPTAGNGALLLEASPGRAVANELNPDRAAALRSLGFQVSERDAAEAAFKPVQFVIANPPFGPVKGEDGESKRFQVSAQYSTTEIDHAIAFNALRALQDDGRAVLIVGGPSKTLSDAGRSDAYNGAAKRAFYFSLYNQFKVVDHFTVAGSLYAKQGAAWPVDVIVIRGRGKSARALPAVDLPRLINSWEDLKDVLATGGLQSAESVDRGDRASSGAVAGAGGEPATGDAVPGETVIRGGDGERPGYGVGGGVRGELGGEPEAVGPERGELADESDDGVQVGGGTGVGFDSGELWRIGDLGEGRARPAVGVEGGSEVGPMEAQAEPWPSLPPREILPLIPRGELAGIRRRVQETLDSDGNKPLYVQMPDGSVVETILPRGPEIQRYLDAVDQALSQSTPRQRANRGEPPTLQSLKGAAIDYQLYRRFQERKADIDALRAGVVRRLKGISETARARRDAGEPEEAISAELGGLFKRGKGYLDWLESRAFDAYITVNGRKQPVNARHQGAEYGEVPEGLREFVEPENPQNGQGGVSAAERGNDQQGAGAAWDAMGYGAREPLADKASGGMRKITHRLAGSKWAEITSEGERERLIKAMRDAGVLDGAKKPEAAKPETVTEGFQAPYQPASAARAVGTLVPVNMQTAVKNALDRVVARHGEVDRYVARELGYEPAEIPKYFSAEQVDALALALDNLGRGRGFIIGDQTGVGKGRVVAGVIRYALRKGQVPIFVTEKPNLYGDMLRDLTDIGMPEIRPVVTNSGFDIPMDDEAMRWYELAEDAKAKGQPAPKREGRFLKTATGGTHAALLAKLTASGKLEGFDVIFTTYNQMQTVKGERTQRMDFLEQFAEGGVVIFDESHNAGGQDAQQRGKKDEDAEAGSKTGRAALARSLVRKAAGVFYSSATYAKRPEVMDLYSKTDMGLGFDKPGELAGALMSGGVPLQQVVAAMLAEAGQYIRREKSFAGIAYDTVPAVVDKRFAENAAEIMRDIMQFDKVKKASIAAMDKDLKADARKLTGDKSTGGAGATSTNFTSVMHNLIGQMLLTLKVKPTIDEALAALRRGEKPVIALANTMGSAIEEYAELVGLNPGDAIALSFGDLMKRYLEKSRRVIEGDAFGKKTVRMLTDQELGPMAVKFYKGVMKKIDGMNFGDVPISPIDAIRQGLKAEGYRVGEITGRTAVIDYSGGLPVFRRRGADQTSTAGKRKTIQDFNSGKLDAIILNQSGATGLSLHASERFTDQRKRHMIITQPELNIDTHMQMLGRVNRTGQVVLPSYAQLVADIPAEKRPAAILAKKMAGLNANTTANRSSAVTAKDVPDFMNEYGDEVAAQVMADNPAWFEALGKPLNPAETGEGFQKEGAIRKVTGRIPVLPLKEQEKVYATIEDSYRELIETKDRMGENALEAKTLDLDAKTVGETEVVKPKSGVDSPFAGGVLAEDVDVKFLGKPYTIEQVFDMIGRSVGVKPGAKGEARELLVTSKNSPGKAGFVAREDFEPYSNDVLPGMRLAIYRNPDDRMFYVVEWGSGLSLADGLSRESAVDNLDKRIAKISPDKVIERVASVQKITDEQRAEAVAALGNSPHRAIVAEHYGAMRDKADADYKAYQEEVRAQLADEEDKKKLDAGLLRLQGQHARIMQLLGQFLPGQPVKLSGKWGDVFGYVGKIERKGRTTNPMALSDWRVTLYVADPSRQWGVNLSQIHLEGAGDRPEGAALLARASTKDVDEAFAEGLAVKRDKRVVLTGNMLAGYGAFKGSGGQIVNFTRKGGGIAQGILMPRRFDLGASLDAKPVVFEKAADVARFVDRMPGAWMLTNAARAVEFAGAGNTVTVRVPAAKADGARYYLDRRILDALGKDFAKAGSQMRAEVPKARLPGVLDALYAMGERLQADSHKEVAREIVGKGVKFSRGDDLPDLTFTDENIGYYSGQKDNVLVAKSGGQVVGTIEYSEFQGLPAIQMIRVPEEFRRRGVATGMVKELQKLYPGQEIEWGMLTDDGAKLYESIPKKSEINKWINAKIQLLGKLRNEMESISQWFDSASDEAPQSVIDEKVARHDKVRDRIWRLEDELWDKSPAKTLIRYSRPRFSWEATQGGSTAASVRAELKAQFGAGFTRMEKAGRVVVFEDWRELRSLYQEARPGDKALFDGKKVYLVAPNIKPGNAAGVFLHDTGVHDRLMGWLGDKLPEFARDFQRLVNAGDAAAVRAENQVQRLLRDGAMGLEEADEERIAYLVEYVVNADAAGGAGISERVRRFVRRVIAALRAALYASPIGPMLRRYGFVLTARDFAALARAAVRRPESGPGPVAGGELRSEINLAPMFYSALARAVEGFKQPKAPGSQWAAMIEKAPGVRAEEIDWSGVKDWLNSRQGVVTKPELLEFLAANSIQVQEVTKGAPSPNARRWLNRMGANGVVPGSTETTYHGLQVAGGENYRELLLTLPSKAEKETFDDYLDRMAESSFAYKPYAEYSDEQKARFHNSYGSLEEMRRRFERKAPAYKKRGDEYHSSHWQEPNILAHVRMNERTDADGRRVLFVEEVQSDWHQAGRKKGYAKKRPTPEDAKKYFDVRDDYWETLDQAGRESYVEEMLDHMRTGPRSERGVPDAPFKQSWPMLAMKRMIRYAAEHGFDRIAWTPGAVQAERYDLSNHIDAIFYSHKEGKWWVTATVGGYELPGLDNEPMDEEKLEATLGKEMAQKIVNGEGEDVPSSNEKKLEGQGLKVGGEGMRGFYDKILPAEVGKYVKKWGVKVGRMPVNNGATFAPDWWSEEDGWQPGEVTAEPGNFQAHVIDITPAMKLAALEEGQPLFARREPVPEVRDEKGRLLAPNGKPSKLNAIQWQQVRTPEFKAWFGDWENDPANASKVVDENGEPLVMYTGTSKDQNFTKFKIPKNGAWFSMWPESASDYAQENDSQGAKYNPDTRQYEKVNTASRVIPVFLNVRNLHQITQDEASRVNVQNYKKAQGAVFDELRGKGFDGVRFSPAEIVVLGNPLQIKSAIGNTGEFSPDNPDIRYSRADDDPQIERDLSYVSASKTRPEWKRRMRELDDASLRAALGAITRDQLAELSADLLPEIERDYLRVARALDGDRNELQEMAGKFLEPWGKLARENRVQAAKLSNVMHEATVNGVDPDVPYAEVIDIADGLAKIRKIKANAAMGQALSTQAVADIQDIERQIRQELKRKEEYTRIKSLWDEIEAPARKIYRACRDFHVHVAEETLKTLQARISEMDAPESIKREMLDKLRVEFESNRVQAPYFPLYRDGDFWLSYRGPGREVMDFPVRLEPLGADRFLVVVRRGATLPEGIFKRIAGKQYHKGLGQSFPVEKMDEVKKRLGDRLTVKRAFKQPGELYFELFETSADRDEFRKSYEAEGMEILGAGKRFEGLESRETVPGEFVAGVETLLKSLGTGPDVRAVRDGVWQMYLKTMPDMSMRRHMIHRTKRKGYLEDALRANAHKAFHDGYQLARLKHMPKLSQILGDLVEDVETAASKPAQARVAADLAKWGEYAGYLRTGDGLQGIDSRLADLSRQRDRDGASTELNREIRKWEEFRDWFKKGMHPERKIHRARARLAAAQRIGGKGQKAIDQSMRYLDELDRFHKLLLNPETSAMAEMLNSFGFMWFLTSPASAFVNTMQTMTVAFPVAAARYDEKLGAGQSAKEFLRALGQFFAPVEGGRRVGFSMGPRLTDPDEVKTFNELHRIGVIDKTLTHDMAGIAERGMEYSDLRFRVMKGLGFAFHHTERLNREVTGMAVYRLARRAGRDHEAAFAETVRALDRTHGNYEASNRARFMRGGGMRVITQFKQYPQFTTFLILRSMQQAFRGADPATRREARRALAGMLFNTGLVAGAAGLPWGVVLGLGPLALWGRKGALGAAGLYAVAWALAGALEDADEPEDWEAAMRTWLARGLGQGGKAMGLDDEAAERWGRKLERAAHDGLVDAFGPWALSHRVGMNNLWLREDDRDLEGDRAYLQWLENLGGPMVGLGKGLFQGASLIGEGYAERNGEKVARGIEAMSPSLLRSLEKAGRFYVEGAVDMRGNDVIPDVSPVEIVGQALGLQPSRLAARQELNTAVKNMDKRLGDRRADILDITGEAALKGDAEKLEYGLGLANRFSEKNPDRGISAKDIKSSVKARARRDAQTENGLYLPKGRVGLRGKFGFGVE